MTSYLPSPLSADVIDRLLACSGTHREILRCRAVAAFVLGIPGCARRSVMVLQSVPAVSLVLAGSQVLIAPGNIP